jgi:anion-transporting  ArsA/GET3 family ATPase
MRELLSIGKVWELAQLQRRTRGAAPYDLVIVDAPATGHGVGILKTPRTFADIARVGPIAHQGRAIADTLADREFTGLVAVATAEEMPVNETLTIKDELAREGLSLDALIVNEVLPARFEESDLERLDAALVNDDPAPLRGAIQAALSEHARARAQEEQLTRLQDGMGMPLVELPFVFAPELGHAELEQLAEALEVGLAGRETAPASRA